MTQKIVTLTFDDGWRSAITHAHPLLQKYDVPTTFYIISERIDPQFNQYMDAEDLHVLEAAGHEIGSHTRSHKHLTELSDEDIWYEITQGLNDLLALGFHPRTFAYPFGEWNPYVVKQVREAGFFAARTIEHGINDDHVNHLLLRALAVRANHSAEEVTSWIQDFIQGAGNWLILYFHQIEPAEILLRNQWIYGTTPAVLEGILAFLKNENISVKTLVDGMEILASS